MADVLRTDEAIAENGEYLDDDYDEKNNIQLRRNDFLNSNFAGALVAKIQPTQKKLHVMSFDEKGSHSFEDLTRTQILERVQKVALTAHVRYLNAQALAMAKKEKAEKSTLLSEKLVVNDKDLDRPCEIVLDDKALFSMLDANHKGVTLEQLTPEQKKEALKGSLSWREMRKIDESFLTASEPCLIVRRHSIILNLYSIKAVICYNQCYVIVPDGADAILKIICDNLTEKKLEPGESRLPLEFRALEAICLSLSALLEMDFNHLEREVQTQLRRTRENPSSTELDKLRKARVTANLFAFRVAGSQEAIGEVLADGDMMSKMSLSFLQLFPETWYADGDKREEFEDVEIMLEHYLEVVDSIGTSMKLLLYDVDSTSSLIEIQLDSSRNKLIKTDLMISTISMGLGLGAMVGGIFGMNLQTPLFGEDNDHWFLGVVYCIAGGMVLLIAFSLWFFNKIGIFRGT